MGQFGESIVAEEILFREGKLGVVTELRSAYHPWVDNYPEGIDWATEIDTAPVVERVLDTCARHPDLIAMDFMGRRTAYHELGRTIEKLSAALQGQLGIAKGTPRGAVAAQCAVLRLVFYYAVLRAGGVIVNCSPLYSVDELTQIVGDSHADIIVTLDLGQLFKKSRAGRHRDRREPVLSCARSPASCPSRRTCCSPSSSGARLPAPAGPWWPTGSFPMRG